MVVVIIIVLAVAKKGGENVAAREKEPEIFINTAKLGGCIGISGFGENGGVGKSGLAKNITENVDKTSRFQLFFEVINRKVL